MSRPRNSIPPSSPARESFRKASEILSESCPPLPKRSYLALAREVEALSVALIANLVAGNLDAIDTASVKLARKCLDVQKETIGARKAKP